MKKVLISAAALVVALVSGIFIAHITQINSADEYLEAAEIRQLKKSERFINTLKIEDAIVKGINEKRELVVMEADAEETVTIDDSWTDFDVFKLNKKVKYKGRGIFTADLAGFDIKIDQLGRAVNVSLSAPVLKTIEILEDETEFQPTEKGFLRFDDISVSLEESNVLMLSVKEAMKETLLTEELNEEAKKRAISAVTGIVSELLKQNNLNYDINISFADGEKITETAS